MALTYTQSADLMNDPAFRGRVKVACMKYATYINFEAANTPAHFTRTRWAQQCILMPDSAAGTVIPTVVMDDAVQQNGAAITDAALQSAVENSINTML